MQSLRQNNKILDLRLKGNRFSENLFEEVLNHINKNNNRINNFTKEKYIKLKREVEQVSLVTDTSKSGIII